MSYDNIDVAKLLQPNLLSEQELISILQARCVKIENMGAMSKEQLLNIFNRVVTPLQQRPSRRSLHSEICDNQHNNINIRLNHISEDERSIKKIKLNCVPHEENRINGKDAMKRKISFENNPSNGITSPKKAREKIYWP